MAKIELKTKENEACVEDFLNTIDDEIVRNDCNVISEMMSKATNAAAKMWGASIVGFGSYHYKSDSGREGDWMIIGFSPRKANISLYGLSLGDDLLAKLGKHKTGKGCLYIKKLSDVDSDILDDLIRKSVSNKS
jgi:Domain of unknown function (DU1801)